MPDLLLPGTEVEARGLQWEVVSSQQLGPQTLYRLRGLQGAVRSICCILSRASRLVRQLDGAAACPPAPHRPENSA